jgi:hypothetical protein
VIAAGAPARSRPQSEPEDFLFSLCVGPDAADAARQRLTELLDARVPASVLDASGLLLSEVMSTCVPHDAGADHAIDVSGCLLPGVLHVEAVSPGRRFERTRLALADELAQRWGVVDATGGSVLWFEVAG